MILFYINNSDRTSDVENNSLVITNQIQQRNDSCSFKVFQGSKPTENQDVKIYDSALVSSHAGTNIVLQDSYQVDVATFRPGQVIWLKIGDASTEKATIATYTESTKTIVLTTAPSISLVSGDSIGELIFGGVVGRVNDENLLILQNVMYQVTGISYSKIFDKKLVADTWEDRDSRFIINDFVNSTVNYNQVLDNVSYDDNSAIQAEWIEANDGVNPTIDAVNFMEGSSAGVFSWTFSGGAARWSASPLAVDVSDLVGAASGQPTKGSLMGWVQTDDYDKISSVKIRIGSSATDYIEVPLPLDNITDWQYFNVNIASLTPTGTPTWTALDYIQLVINETASGSVRLNGLRINAQYSFTVYNVTSTPVFSDLRSPQLKPTALMNLLAKTWEYVWYVDYERDVHFVAMETYPAPLTITDTSNNFEDFSYEIDTSNLGNRVIVRGGEKTSASRYAQVIEGTGEKREWLMKSKFNNMELLIDNNTSTDTMEATTSTTTVKATAHGLATGDHIVNRTRSNAVREVTVVDADTFTVQAVTSQTSGDTFSKFTVTKTLGVEGLTDETTVDYVANSNEKSVRATDSETTYSAGTFLRFEYNERLPIQVRYVDSASVAALKAVGLGDGIFDLDPYTDRNIKDSSTALTIARARVSEFSNPVITGSFKTEQKGLCAGQLITIVLTEGGRTIDDSFVIQRVSRRQRQGMFKDNIECSVTFGTTLFGWEELMQKILRQQDSIELNVDDIVETYITADEEVGFDDTNSAVVGGFKKATQNEETSFDDSNQVTKLTPPWQWETSTGQPVATRWDLFEWG